MCTEKRPDVSGMKIFGCNAFVYLPKAKRKTWSAKSKKMKFFGYQDGTRNYRFVDKYGRIIRSPNATFIESKRHKLIEQKNAIKNHTE